MHISLKSPMVLVACLGLSLACGKPDDSAVDDGTTDATTDSGETETDTGTTGDGDGDTGGGAMCDPKAQDCPEGEKCTFYRDELGDSANKCVPISGDDQEGDPCMALAGDTDTCAAGLHCWGTEPDNSSGACVEFCDENNQCSSGDPCTVTNNGTLPMCLPVCDPFAPDCPAGWACYDDWYSDDWFCDRDVSGDLGIHGDPCEKIAGCNPGLICAVAEVVDSEVCATSGASGCCTEICDLSDPIPCVGAGEQCIPYYLGDAPPQYANVGMCAIPG